MCGNDVGGDGRRAQRVERVPLVGDRQREDTIVREHAAHVVQPAEEVGHVLDHM
jgi:hypothetical protein